MAVIDRLNERLAAGEVVVIDGGMGTELQARGVPMDGDAWCALANLEHLDTVREVHEDYIRAGADVIITNTYAAARLPLSLAGYADRVGEANRRAVEAAQAARERAADRPVAIAGSMSLAAATDIMFRGRPERDQARLRDDYREQASALAEAGVDLFALEMIGSAWYGSLALEAAAETGLPVWLGVSVYAPTAGKLPPVGEPDGDLADLLDVLLGPRVAAVTVMHTAVAVVDAALDVIEARWSGPTGVYPHVGSWSPPNWQFAEIEPAAFAACARAWVERGVQMVGGCCGIRPAHIRAVADALSR